MKKATLVAFPSWGDVLTSTLNLKKSLPNYRPDEIKSPVK